MLTPEQERWDIETLIYDATGVENWPEYEAMGSTVHDVAETAVVHLRKQARELAIYKQMSRDAVRELMPRVANAPWIVGSVNERVVLYETEFNRRYEQTARMLAKEQG